MPEHVTFTVPEEFAGERLDKWLAAPERDLQMTRSAVQLRMEQQAVLVNGTPVPKTTASVAAMSSRSPCRNRSR